MIKSENNEVYVLSIVLLAYASSWFLPILRDTVGYDGAEHSIKVLNAGISYFTLEEASSEIKNIHQAIYYIIAGLPNILFVISFALLIIKAKWCYIISPLMVLSMAVWFSTGNQIGYYVWLACGISVLLISASKVKKSYNLQIINMVTRIWSLPIYLPLGLVSYLLLMQYLQKST